jgi:hypothetical protein
MRLSKLALVAAIACGTYAGNVFADQTNGIELASCAALACDSGCETDCCDDGCEDGCDGGCDSRCNKSCSFMGLDMSWLGGGDCCLGEPCTLFDGCCGVNVGGWLQMGYSSQSLPAFNTLSDTLQMQQAWLFAEKVADGSCGFDIGGRADYLYGTDAQNTQAFGTDPSGWDNSWDNGDYGRALPQLYLEAAYGDLSVKAGKFFTIIGYEVVPATGNFFYSHSYTFNFSEPFTHTGVLADYQVNCDTNIWGGWTAGWDSGFDDNGSAFLGGISTALSRDLTVTYAATGGRFADVRYSGRTTRGYMHSIVADYACSDDLQYIFQSDYQDTEDAAGATDLKTFGINQYLIKTINDCCSYGARFEWWNRENATNTADLYAMTFGLNHRPHANVVIRPELRFDWDNNGTSGLLAGGSRDQTTFGIDGIVTF